MADADRYLTTDEFKARKDRRRIYELANDDNLSLEELEDGDHDEEMGVAEDNIEAAIGDAADTADELLSKRMAVPLESVNGIFKQLVADVAMFFLAKRRSTEVPSDLRKPYEDALAALETWGSGGMLPPIAGRNHRKPFSHHHHGG